jgi:hypothetical protein
VADIFLSYAREDRSWASRLAAGLIERGWSLFWDSHIPVGKSFDQVIENQLDAARCIVVLWSRHSISSNWVKAEASEGARRGILHPVLIENVRLPLEFRRLQTANLIDWQRGTAHGEFDQLIGGIASTLRTPTGLLREARAALGRGDCAQCLEILLEIADAAEAAGLGGEVAELRRTAEAAQDEARRGELRRQRARAEEQRAAIGTSRSHAQAADAATRASALWLAAEAKMGEAAAAFDDEALPMERPKPRPTRRLGGSRLVACVGGVAVVLSALGVSWYRSAHEETPKILTGLPSRAPQPQEPSPSPPSALVPAPGLPPATNREREVVEDLSTKAAAAREQATKASAEGFANALFATAAGHQGDAEAARAGGRLADAEAAYRRALDGFAVAATEAQNVLARKQDEPGRLQNHVEVSHRTVAGPQAEKLAGPEWTKATRLRQTAQAAVAQGDRDKAGELLKEATVRDRFVGPSGARADAEQARSRMATAKRAAEQVAAGFFAYKRFTSAQSKERAGIAALGQSDYGAALRLLVEAQSEYQAAVQEARRESERDGQLAPLTASLEQAHAAAAAQRQQALAAEAHHLAKDVFYQAQARQVEADGLENRQDLAAAARAYQDAAERYGEATLRARAARAAK